MTRPTLTVAEVRSLVGPVAALVAAAWWLIEVTRSWAGRDAPSVTVGAVLIAVAVVLTRPDRVLPRSAVIFATAISAGAFVVPLTADTGWAGAPDAAVYACGAWLAIVSAAVIVTRPDTMVWFLTLIAASAPVQFMSGWLGWWGGKDPTQPMVGTFYWHNPYAAFLIPGGLVGLAFWIWRERLFALLGLICFAFATVGIVYSTSRASLAAFILGVVLVLALAIARATRWRDVRQLAIAALIAAAAAYFVGGPPFFPHRSSPLSGEQARAATQSLGQNGGYRLDFWREALTVFWHHPLTGGGYKGLASESSGHVPSSWPLSPYAHNGYLQALGEGGLILGIPFLLAVIAVAVICLRTLFRGIVRRDLPVEAVVVAIALACVMLHSGVDFDWTYAADFAMASVLAGLVLGCWLTTRASPSEMTEADRDKPGPSYRVAVAGCALAGVALLGLSAWVMRNGNHRENLSIGHTALNQGETVFGR